MSGPHNPDSEERSGTAGNQGAQLRLCVRSSDNLHAGIKDYMGALDGRPFIEVDPARVGHWCWRAFARVAAMAARIATMLTELAHSRSRCRRYATTTPTTSWWLARLANWSEFHLYYAAWSSLIRGPKRFLL
jgi:hypothetical protein